MGQNRILKPMDPRLIGEDAAGVKYIDDLKVRREKYQVEIGSTMRRRGMDFDTKEIESTSSTRVGSGPTGTDGRGSRRRASGRTSTRRRSAPRTNGSKGG